MHDIAHRASMAVEAASVNDRCAGAPKSLASCGSRLAAMTVRSAVKAGARGGEVAIVGEPNVGKSSAVVDAKPARRRHHARSGQGKLLRCALVILLAIGAL